MKLVSSLLLALALSGLRIGIGPASAADVSAGKATAETCAGCHGADGVSQMPLTPSLAGQSDEFVQWQLVYFRSGTRKSEVMGPIAEALTNEEIRNLGAYYASLPPPPGNPHNRRRDTMRSGAAGQALRRPARARRPQAAASAAATKRNRRRGCGFPRYSMPRQLAPSPRSFWSPSENRRAAIARTRRTGRRATASAAFAKCRSPHGSRRSSPPSLCRPKRPPPTPVRYRGADLTAPRQAEGTKPISCPAHRELFATDQASMREASLYTERPARLSVRHAAPSSDGILFGLEDMESFRRTTSRRAQRRYNALLPTKLPFRR